MASSILGRTIVFDCSPTEQARIRPPCLSRYLASRFNSSPAECSCSQSRTAEFSPTSQIARSLFGNRDSALPRHRMLGVWKDEWTRGRSGSSVVTMAIPTDVYWITAYEAIGLPLLMSFAAMFGGIILNKMIEQQALKEYNELVAKGMNPNDLIPSEADFDENEPLYIFNSQELTSATRGSRNRPIREELESEADAKLEAAGTSSSRDEDGH